MRPGRQLCGGARVKLSLLTALTLACFVGAGPAAAEYNQKGNVLATFNGHLARSSSPG